MPQTDFCELLVVKCTQITTICNLLLKFYRGKNPSLPRLSCGYRGKFPAALWSLRAYVSNSAPYVGIIVENLQVGGPVVSP